MTGPVIRGRAGRTPYLGHLSLFPLVRPDT